MLPVIAVDFDEVLSLTHNALIEFHNQMYNTQLKHHDFIAYNYYEIWGGTYEESIEKTRLFYSSDYFTQVRPVPNAYVVLSNLKKRFDLVVITARQETLKSATLDFLDRNFNGIFKNVFFTNQYISQEESKYLKSTTKGTLCKELNVVAIIDDSLTVALECASLGIDVFLFDLDHSYYWNKIKECPSNVHRVLNWTHIAEWFGVNSPHLITENCLALLSLQLLAVNHPENIPMPSRYDFIKRVKRGITLTREYEWLQIALDLFDCKVNHVLWIPLDIPMNLHPWMHSRLERSMEIFSIDNVNEHPLTDGILVTSFQGSMTCRIATIVNNAKSDFYLGWLQRFDSFQFRDVVAIQEYLYTELFANVVVQDSLLLFLKLRPDQGFFIGDVWDSEPEFVWFSGKIIK